MAEFMKTANKKTGYKRMKVDIEKLNSFWKFDSSQIPSLYIPTEFSGIISDQQKKYLNSRIDLFEGSKQVECPPEIEYYKDTLGRHRLSFVDGRNRFANLRDMGAKYIYVNVSKRSEQSEPIKIVRGLIGWSG